MDYKHEHLEVDGKSIWIYDDCFTTSDRIHFYDYVSNSNFGPIATDTNCLEHKGSLTLASHYNEHDHLKMGLWSRIPEEILDTHGLGLDILDSTMVNLSTHGDHYHAHTDHVDQACLTMLYYANVSWDIEWGGDTVFLDDSAKRIRYTGQYVPGRLLIFDPRIPHLIRPPTRLAPDYRFTIAFKFIPNRENND